MNEGTIAAITGDQVDVTFEAGTIPAIHNLLAGKQNGKELLLEVEQHLDAQQVRCVTLTPSDGWKLGLKVTDTGAPLMVPVGEHVLGRVLNVFGEPIDGLGPIIAAPRLPIYPPNVPSEAGAPSQQMLETGIKGIDLFAPVACGGRIGVFAVPGVGQLVLLAELIHNVATHRAGHAVCVGLEERTYEVQDLMRELRELGVDTLTAMVFGQRNEALAARQRAVLAGLTIAEHFRDQGENVLLLVDQQLPLARVLENLHGRMCASQTGSITLVVFGWLDDGAGPEVEQPVALDGQILFDRILAKQGLFPAVDPLASSSRILESRVVGEEHVQVVHQVRQLLQRYRDLHDILETHGIDELSDEERRVVVRARRMQRFLTQPFGVAEPWTGIPGEYVRIEDTLAGLIGLLEGRYDKVPEEAFKYVGAIDQVLEKA